MKLFTDIRRVLLLAMRQDVKQHWRGVVDLCNGMRFDATTNSCIAPQPIQLTQPIMPSAFYANKLINLSRGAALLDQTSIAPGRN